MSKLAPIVFVLIMASGMLTPTAHGAGAAFIGNLVSFYRFSDQVCANGASVNDYMGFQNGTATGFTNPTDCAGQAGQFDGAWHFGTNKYVQFGSNKDAWNLKGTQAVTITGWVNTASLTGTQRLLSIEGMLDVRIGGTSLQGVGWATTTGCGTPTTVSGGTFSLNTWTFFAVSFNGATLTIYLGTSGVPSGTGALLGNLCTPAAGTDGLSTVGCVIASGTPTECLTNAIEDELRIYNGVLTGAQIASVAADNPVQVPTLGLMPRINGDGTLNATMTSQGFDSVCSCLLNQSADALPKITILAFNGTSYPPVVWNDTMFSFNPWNVPTYYWNKTLPSQNLSIEVVVTGRWGGVFASQVAWVRNLSNLTDTSSFCPNVPTNDIQCLPSNAQGAKFESQTHANATWCPIGALDGTCVSNGYANATFEGQAHANATWESQAHANATWCPVGSAASACVGNGYANATFEGQSHANATWESQAHANATWCPVGSATSACVGNGYANATFEGQAHANATWCQQGGTCSGNFTGNTSGNFFGNFTGNFTILDAMGTLTLATSWDQYVPAVFWLVLMIFFAWRVAPFPFFVSFMGLGAAISPIPYQPLAFVALMMLLAIAIVVNALTQWGVALAERVISAAKARVVAARERR